MIDQGTLFMLLLSKIRPGGLVAWDTDTALLTELRGGNIDFMAVSVWILILDPGLLDVFSRAK